MAKDCAFKLITIMHALMTMNSGELLNISNFCSFQNIKDCNIHDGFASCSSSDFAVTVATLPGCITRFHYTTLPVDRITFNNANFTYLVNLKEMVIQPKSPYDRIS